VTPDECAAEAERLLATDSGNSEEIQRAILRGIGYAILSLRRSADTAPAAINRLLGLDRTPQHSGDITAPGTKPFRSAMDDLADALEDDDVPVEYLDDSNDTNDDSIEPDEDDEDTAFLRERQAESDDWKIADDDDPDGGVQPT
jgi:hypothetical protein